MATIDGSRSSGNGWGKTKNCAGTRGHYETSEISRLDIQDRFGAFLAIRWPTKDVGDYDDIVVLQHLFPSLFAYLFRDAGLLEGKAGTRTREKAVISGTVVIDGIISRGMNDGEPLFVD